MLNIHKIITGVITIYFDIYHVHVRVWCKVLVSVLQKILEKNIDISIESSQNDWKQTNKKTPNHSHLQFPNLEACVCPIILCLLVSKNHHFISYTVYFGHVDTILYNKRMSLLILYMLIIHIMVQNISVLVSIRVIF